ncbi:MAG TPA: hypothetical protein VM141_10285, partial [Planctomycetota bacterium]|nr:hypothetical protein [Planctomycetota bacterium]
MSDDQKIVQVIQRKNLLTSEQIESVNETIRRAAENGEDLKFIQAVLRMALLTDYQAQQVRQEAEQEISSSETEDIAGSIPGAGSEATPSEAGEAPVASAEADAADSEA